MSSLKYFTSAFLILLNPFTVSFAYEEYHKVWPAAQIELYSEASTALRTVKVKSSTWRIKGFGIRNDNVAQIFQAAVDRFEKVLKAKELLPFHATDYPVNPEDKSLWPLYGIDVHISDDVPGLKQGVDESYELAIPPIIDNSPYAVMRAGTIYGVLHGFQSLLQLLQFGWFDEKDKHPVFTVPNTPLQIIDAPTYPYRGLLIDTSRHFLPVELILKNLDAMEMNKLNVLHWHITDSQSWPFQSLNFPNLSKKGAFCQYQEKCTYSPEQVEEIMQAASIRGIRVVIEVDLPGHSQAIAKSHPEFMTDCGAKGVSEPLDVTKPESFQFVQKLYEELASRFPENLIHVGGDEVSLECWKRSKSVQDWMHQHNVTAEIDLLHMFEERLLTFVIQKLLKRPIVWQEIFDSGVRLPNDTIVAVWKSWDSSARENATRDGFNVIFAACWYLDYLDSDFSTLYQCDPRYFNGTMEQKKLVVGGHASMWGEMVDETNFMSRVWPRASAVSEKLWTGNNTKATSSASLRIERFRCYMLRRGISASPIGPGSCGNHFVAAREVTTMLSNAIG